MNKTIYMCYKNIPDLKAHAFNWKVLNPDWNLELFDDKRCKEFLLKEYSKKFVDIFDYIKDGPIKADFWRVCILCKFGGLYVDCDIEPIMQLDYYIDDEDYFVTCTSHYRNDLCNPHLILAHKDNEILKKALIMYLNFYDYKKKYDYWGWSIVTVFNNIIFLKNLLKHSGEQIHYINNKKYKFICEYDKNKCIFKNKVVLKNRYDNYVNHKFIKNQEIVIGASKVNNKTIILKQDFDARDVLIFNTKKEKFDYTFKNKQLLITRIDEKIGWDHKLIGKCLYTIIGSSAYYVKKIYLDKVYPKNSIISFYHKYNDSFDYKFEKNILTITRTDIKEGWGQNLKGYINQIIIGPSDLNTKYIKLDTKFPINEKIFFTNSKHQFNYRIDNYILKIIRIDKDAGWNDRLIANIF